MKECVMNSNVIEFPMHRIIKKLEDRVNDDIKSEIAINFAKSLIEVTEKIISTNTDEIDAIIVAGFSRAINGIGEINKSIPSAIIDIVSECNAKQQQH